MKVIVYDGGIFKTENWGLENNSSLLKCLLHRQEELSSIPSTHIAKKKKKKAGILAHTWNTDAMEKQENLRGSLSSHLIREAKDLVKSPCFNKQGRWFLRNYTRRLISISVPLYKQGHTCIYQYEYTCTRTQRRGYVKRRNHVIHKFLWFWF